MTVPSGSAVRRDIPQPSKPDDTIWGSDALAEMLRVLDIPYVLLNPGASFRGLHDSLVNHLGNENPQIKNQEDITVTTLFGSALTLLGIFIIVMR